MMTACRQRITPRLFSLRAAAFFELLHRARGSRLTSSGVCGSAGADRDVPVIAQAGLPEVAYYAAAESSTALASHGRT